MRKEGDRLIIEPTRPKSLLAVLANLKPLDDEFPPSWTWMSIPSSFDALPQRGRAAGRANAHPSWQQRHLVLSCGVSSFARAPEVTARGGTP